MKFRRREDMTRGRWEEGDQRSDISEQEAGEVEQLKVES
jgi:hypothetical protein